jgi:hypothetical protein
MHGDGRGCNLVKGMQLGCDFQTTWIMSNHVKRVEGWTTLACHVYDFFYCKVTKIVICDMQFENMEAQCVMWCKLNKVMPNNGVPNSKFKGFMADSVKAN